jgi:uncharacterized protein YkwD
MKGTLLAEYPVMQLRECLDSSKYLLVVLAITGASCAGLQSADRLFGGDNAQSVTDATTIDDTATSSRYDTRDDTIDLVANLEQPPLEKRLLTLVNKERENAGIQPLDYSPLLAKAARQHSITMAEEGFFEHRGEGEPKLFDRVIAVGMSTDHVGENIFKTSEGVSAAVADECVQMWMQSEGHRMNMLSPVFDKTGIAVKVSRNGENYITEDFAH